MYDVTVAAQSYSEVAGIIAAFSFAVLVWLVERLYKPEGVEAGLERSTIRALVLLVMTFIGNLLTSLMWAQIAGEVDAASVRTSLLSWLTGLNFGLVVPVMLQSIIFVIASTKAASAIPLFRRIFFASVLLSLGQQWASSIGLLRTLWPSASILGDHLGMLAVCLPLSGGVILAGAVASRRALERRRELASAKSFSWFISLWLVGAVATVVAFGAVRTIGASTVSMPAWLVGVANVVWSAILGWALVFLPV
jgi:hypothetical protein